MSGQELKPCPFCGGEAIRHNFPDDEYGNAGGDVIECSVCLASSHVEFGFKENLVSAWNRRTPDPAQIRADAIRGAAALMEVAATNCRAAFTYPPRTKEERDYQTGALIHTYARNAILALIDAPLSPTAVDGSPAPDAGGKEGV